MRKIMKIFFLSFVLMCFVSVLTSCDFLMKNPDTGTTEPGDTNTPTETTNQREAIYKLAVESGYTGTYEEWLESIKGDYIELSVTSTHIVWKYASESLWRNLIELSKLSGLQGAAGSNGADGKTPEFRVNAGYLEWKYTTDINWIKLYEITTNSNTSSGNTPQNKTEYVTVTFVTKFEFEKDAESFEDVKIIEFVKKEVPVGNIAEPTDIISEEETCYGWYYYDKYQGFVPWLFDAYYNSKDLVLYADVRVEYDVTYLDENGNVYEVLPVRENGYAYEINYESKTEGQRFVGWSVDGKEVFDFSTPINSDLTLKPLLTDSVVIELVYSGSSLNKEFNMSLFEEFKLAREAAGDPNTYEISYVEHEPEVVDSKIIDWTIGPDVYEFTSDKIAGLYQKGAVSTLPSESIDFINNELNQFAQECAQINGSVCAYPYTGDDTYFLQYDASKFTAEEVKSVESILAKCEKEGWLFGYNLEEAYWGGGAMFTYGADYSIAFDVDGSVNSISADFDGVKGQKAIKAIEKIMSSKAWTSTMAAPTPENNLAACIAGTWEIGAYKEALGDDYACAVMPTVTVDGDTQHLGAFLGGKLLGVNPQSSNDDEVKLQAAHELAKFLAGYECQIKRCKYKDVPPTHVVALEEAYSGGQPNVAVLVEHAQYAHAQTTVPTNYWGASSTLVASIKENLVFETPDELDYELLAKELNNSIIDEFASTPEVQPEGQIINYYIRGNMNSWDISEEYLLKYDPSSDTATITVTIEAGVEFKIASDDWQYEFGVIDGEYVNYHGCGNIKLPESGMYLITIYNVSDHVNAKLTIELQK